MTLVYGGVDTGLMGCISKAVKSNGGKLTGIIPTILEDGATASQICDTIITTSNLSERKDKMAELADAIIALPGGIGTLDEIFTVAAATSAGYNDKRVLLYNINGFYDKLLSLVNELHQAAFLRQAPESYFTVANNFEEIISALNKYNGKHN